MEHPVPPVSQAVQVKTATLVHQVGQDLKENPVIQVISICSV